MLLTEIVIKKTFLETTVYRILQGTSFTTHLNMKIYEPWPCTPDFIDDIDKDQSLRLSLKQQKS